VFLDRINLLAPEQVVLWMATCAAQRVLVAADQLHQYTVGL